MNEQTRYVMAIYELGAIIRDSMEYLLPPGEKGYSVEIYKQRKEMISHLIVDNSPFMLFCKQNTTQVKDSDQTIGDKISSQVKEFVNDVYADDGRIVKIDHDKVVVETSLTLQLMDYIIGLHETLSDVCLGFRDSFQKAGTLEDDFSELLTVDDPFYRAVAFRSVASVFVMKFAEYNNAIRSYIAQEREKNGVDPSTQPGFDPKVDPSCAFISNEMNRVVGFFNFLRQHNKSKDVIFLSSIDKMGEDFHYFDGSKKLAEGQKMQDAMAAFETIFIPLIPGYRDAWLKVFNGVFASLVAYEQKLVATQQEAAKAAVNPAPAAGTEEAKPVEEDKNVKTEDPKPEGK
jgi:hypothetical protein